MCWNLLSLITMENNPLRGLYGVSSPRPKLQLVTPSTYCIYWKYWIWNSFGYDRTTASQRKILTFRWAHPFHVSRQSGSGVDPWKSACNMRRRCMPHCQTNANGWCRARRRGWLRVAVSRGRRTRQWHRRPGLLECHRSKAGGRGRHELGACYE